MAILVISVAGATARTATAGGIAVSKIMLAAAVALAAIAAPVSFTLTSAGAQTPAAETKAAPKAAKKSARPPTPGQLAARERQRKCAAEWKVAKADGKVDKAMTWPKYWSACNKRLKAG